MPIFERVGQALTQCFARLLDAPPGSSGASFDLPDGESLSGLQQRFLDRQRALWTSMLSREAGEPPATDADGDRRFASPEWRSSPLYDYIRQSYRLNSQFISELAELFPASDGQARDRARFLARQFNDSLSPANFAATNPEFIRRAIDSQGQSIADGINNLIADFAKGRISLSDESAFAVGRNLATTPGSVVFENELIQLIQYSPTTARVARRPLLIVPPCINKYYILDLHPGNSFVRYALGQGNTVFMLSWRNPGAAQGNLTWDDYLERGPLAAIDVVRSICRVDTLNALGWCVGGTLLSSALAVLAARGQDKVASLTLLTTLLDFSQAGELGLFIDEPSQREREAAIGKAGLIKGGEMASVFSLLRANDLIWNPTVSNYLKGEPLLPFDLLYWNSDSTNLPGPFACWYLRHLYLENGLCIADRLEMCGVKVDLGRIRVPSYVLATRDDHVVPWQSAYRTTQLLGGASRFVLGASGHIAGVINPPSQQKRSYWINGEPPLCAEDWLAGAQEQGGSWWDNWSAWLAHCADGQRVARTRPGSAKFRPIEPAPGRYVTEKFGATDS
jgi:polyhydroxyalkanoate synthase